jgi:phosphohistidine phosphatase SixA
MMTTQIVFIRHGIAEARAPDLSDFSRRLTKKGEQKLRDALPQLAGLLHTDQDVRIWSSPLVRARLTADIAADILRVQEVIIHDFIGKGDYTGFMGAFEKLNPSIHHTVIVVGHEPHMGNWSQTLCGVFLPFKKGAAASFVIGRGGIKSAELEWFLQPELFPPPRGGHLLT